MKTPVPTELRLLGQGRTADIYAWETGWVLKRFHAWVPEAMAQREFDLARRAYAAGAHTPAVKDFVRHADRWGFVMEHVVGSPMLRVLTAQPWRLIELAYVLADEHARLHERVAYDWPAQRTDLITAIQQAGANYPAARDAVLQALAALPDGDRLCHGDFHPDNVLLTARGPVIIDWIDSTRGNPLADVARTSLLAQLGDPPPDFQGRWILQLGRGLFRGLYLHRYFQQAHTVKRADLAAWALPITAARLAEGIEPEVPALLMRLRQALPPEIDLPLV